VVESDVAGGVAGQLEQGKPFVAAEADLLAAGKQQVHRLGRSHPRGQQVEDRLVVAELVVVPEGVVALGGEDGRVAGKPSVAGVAGEEGAREDVAEGGVAADVICVGVANQGQHDLLRSPP
jgi:hypothetical protein